MKSIKSLLHRKKSTKAVAPTLIHHTDKIWRGSIILLIVLTVTVILFDGYIFVFKVFNIEKGTIDVSTEIEVSGLNKKAYTNLQNNLADRKKLFDGAGDSVPERNPFR
jgi:hypothetical protein